MSKIICLLEHASELINGIKFGPVEGVEGLVSEEVNDSVAEIFLSIPGYVLHGAEGEEDGDLHPQAPAAHAAATETPAQRKARLKAEKEEAERKTAEAEASEKDAADAAAEGKAEEPTDNSGADKGEVF